MSTFNSLNPDYVCRYIIWSFAFVIAARNISQNNIPEFGIFLWCICRQFSSPMWWWPSVTQPAPSFVCETISELLGVQPFKHFPKILYIRAWQWVIFFIYEQEIIGFFMFCFTFFSETIKKNVITGRITFYIHFTKKNCLVNMSEMASTTNDFNITLLFLHRHHYNTRYISIKSGVAETLGLR